MNPTSQIRAAGLADIPSMHRIRLAVRENELSDPGRVGEDDYRDFVDASSGWVAETSAGLAGFAIVDLARATVWALFVSPEFEGQGLGTALHDHMIDWARVQRITKLSLSTGPGTRAERFYRRHGWQEAGGTPSGEVRFKRRP